MINLVKAELSYMKTEWLRSKAAYGLIGLFFLVIVGNITVSFIVAADGKLFDYTRFVFFLILIIIGFLPIVYIVMQLQLLLREYREKRVRLQSLLPVAIKDIGYARLLTPFVLLLEITVVAVIFLLLYFNVKPTNPTYGREVFDTAETWLALGIIQFTYGLRLFSERIGIILGSLYIGIMALGSIYIGTGNERDYIIPLFHNFVEYMNNPILFVVMTILFCMLIHMSFIKRKSYLR